MVSDRIRSIKKIFIICLSATICLLMTLPIYKNVWLIGLAFATITFFETGMVPLLDNWVIQSIKNKRNVFYGGIRLWGSLGFTVSVYIINVVIDYTSINSMFVFFAVLGMATILWALKVNDQKQVAHLSSVSINWGQLLKQKEYVIFLIFSVFIFIPMRASSFFLPHAVELVGGGQSLLGIAMAALAVSEVPIFFISGRLIKRFEPKVIILFSSIFFVLRQLLYYLSVTPLHLIGVQAMQGITFGLFLSGAVYYIDTLAPDNLKSTAQTIATAVYLGIGGVVGSYGGGWIIDHYGIRTMYLLGTLISLVISVLFFISVVVLKEKKPSSQT